MTGQAVAVAAIFAGAAVLIIKRMELSSVQITTKKPSIIERATEKAAAVNYAAAGATRGIKNNNAGNVRDNGIGWQGLDVPRSDGDYLRFIAPEWGVRAIAKVLKSYRRRGVVRLVDIISTYAPHFENPTDAYVMNVSKWTGIGVYKEVLEADYPLFIAAIIRQENGVQPYPVDLIKKGVSMA